MKESMQMEYPVWPQVTERDRENLRFVCDSGRWSSGFWVDRFESQYRKWTGVKHVVPVANGTVALEMILRGLGVGYGDEVILPPYTFIATLSAVVFVGARPVFVDIDRETYNLDPAAVEAKITPRTRAVIAVAVAGCPPDLGRLEELTDQYELPLVVDAAQAVGAQWEGKSIDQYGAASFISCQNSKNLSCGEGGILTTNDEGLAATWRAMLDGSHEEFYTDNGMTEFQAALICSQMEKLSEEIALREKLAGYLDEKLAELAFVRPMRRDPEVTVHAHHLYLMRFDEDVLRGRGLSRDEFVRALQAEGIPLAGGYEPLYSFPFVSAEETELLIGGRIDTAPLACCEAASYREGAWLTQNVLLSDEPRIDAIVDALVRVWEGAIQSDEGGAR